MTEFTSQTLTPEAIMLHYKAPQTGGNRVQIDAQSHMQGPGRYINPGLFVGVQRLATDISILNGGQSFISYEDLIANYGYQVGDFRRNVDQRLIDVYSSDYATRAFVYGTESYEISFTGVTVEDGKIFLTSYQIRDNPNFQENFDAVAGGSLAAQVLGGAFDVSLGTGTRVEMDYISHENIPTFSSYDTSRAQTDASQLALVLWDPTRVGDPVQQANTVVAVAKFSGLLRELDAAGIGEFADWRAEQEQNQQDFIEQLLDFFRNGPHNSGCVYPRLFQPSFFAPGSTSVFAGWTLYRQQNGPLPFDDEILVWPGNRVHRYAGLYFDLTGQTIPEGEITFRPGFETTVMRITPSEEEGAPPEVEIARTTDEDGVDGPRAPIVEQIPFAQIGAVLGSNLARALAIEDPWSALAAGTLLGTIGLNLGQAIENAVGDAAVIGVKEVDDVIADVVRSQAFGDLGLDLASAGAGAVSSYLLAEWIADAGIEGVGGELASNLSGAAVGKIIDNLALLARGITHVEGASGLVPLKPFTGVDVTLLANAAGSFVGAYLASKLVHFDTVAGQIGASLGSGIGGIVGAKVIGAWLSNIGWIAGPIGAAIGAFIGYIVGGLIGSLFGGTPKAGAGLGWDESAQRYELTYSWARHGGSKDAAKSIASNVAELLNAVIAAAGAHVNDAAGVQVGAYETKGGDFIYKASDTAQYAYRTADASKLMAHGQFIALSDLSDRLLGGDVYVKRAIASTLAKAGGNPLSFETYSAGSFDVSTLLGNIATAQAYREFANKAGAVTALVSSAPESALASDWIVTLARVIELGLDKRWASDWLGGWGAFLDEAHDGALDGQTFAPANVVLVLDPTTNERLFGFFNRAGNLAGVLGDTIDTASKDVIEGTSGNNTLTVAGDTITLTTSLTLNGEAAPAGAHKIRVAALIDGGAGNDTIRGGDLGNDLIGGEGDDTLIGGKLDDWAFGGAGNDRLYAGNVADPNAAEAALIAVDGGNGNYIEGGLGDDALYGASGSDWLSGGEGADRLLGGAGGDILAGGQGDDRGANGEARLFGGAGSDQYVFGFGDGVDVIFDESDPSQSAGTNGYNAGARLAGLNNGTITRNWAGNGEYEADGSVRGGEDAISLGAGISMHNILMRRVESGGQVGADLVIDLVIADENGVRVPTGDSLTIKDWFNDTRRVEWLRFADGQELRIGNMASFVIGTAEADVIIGTPGADFLVGSDGDDEIRGLGGNDFAFGDRGRDFVAGDDSNDLVMGGDDDDQVLGGYGNDTVFGDGGADHVYGGAGNDILAGGRGGDTVIGGAGADLFRYARGDGADVVFDNYCDNWELVWDGGAWVGGYQLNGAGQVTKDGVVYFDDGIWAGLMDWRDGEQKLLRHLGANASGAFTSNSGDDILEFGFGIDIEDVQLRRNGGDLNLAISAGAHDAIAFDAIVDRITLREWFSTGAQIEHFVFIETGTLDVANWSLGASVGDGDDVVTGGVGRDWITGGLGDDVVSGAAGDDILSGNPGVDSLKGAAGADVLFGGAGDDVLDGGAEADELIGGEGTDIASYASYTGAGAGVRASLAEPNFNTLDAAGDKFSGIEGLEGSIRADTLSGDANDNVLRGLGGDDMLQGGKGDDAYEVNVGEGDDVIRDHGIVIEEIVSAAGALNAAYTATWSYAGTSVLFGVTWHNYDLSVRRISDNELIYSSQAGDFKYSALQANAPAAGSWPWSGGQWVTGAIRSGTSARTILENAQSGDGGADSLEFGANVSLSDLSAAWENSGADLRLSIAGGGSVLIETQNQADNAVEDLILADGLSARLTGLKLAGAAGSAGEDLFIGSADADSFAAGAGNDVVSGGAGADDLAGGDGDDVLEGGAGGDILSGGADSASGGAAPIAGDLTRAYGDTLRYARSASGVTIDLGANTASGGDAQGDVISGVENVMGSGAGDVLGGGDGANRLAGLAGNDTLEGRGGDDVLLGGAGDDVLLGGDGEDNIVGDAGADSIDGGADNDVIAGGEGADAIEGGAGADMIEAGAGDDSAHGGDGADEIIGGDGADALYGDAGDDRLHGDLGADTLYGGDGADTLVGAQGDDLLRGEAGDDVYVFDALSGLDEIVDAAGANAIAIIGAAMDQVWITRIGDDLRIGLIGATNRIIVKDYYAAVGASLIRSISTETHTLYLGHAGALIGAMSAHDPVTPAAMPASVSEALAPYWHAGGKAAPIVADQALNSNEDVVLTGQVVADDHDDQVLSYAVASARAQGALTLDAATGAWSFVPAADWNGADGFDVRVTDTDGQSVIQRVALTVAPVNDAPRTLTAGALEIGELAAHAASIGAAFAATDVDDAQGVLAFTLVDDAGGRFAMTAAGQLQVNRTLFGEIIDYEANQSHTIRVRVSDAAGASLEQDFVVTLTEENEAPTNITTTGLTIDENVAVVSVVGAFVGIDPDGAIDPLSFTLDNDAGGRFTVTAAGELRIVAGANLDHESAASHTIVVRATDRGGLTFTKSFAVDVGDVNEAPTDVALAPSGAAIYERDRIGAEAAPGAVLLGSLSGVDPDLATSGAFAELAYSVADSRFEIRNSDELWLKAGAMADLDYETNPSESVSVTVKDLGGGPGALSFTRSFDFALTNRDDVLLGTASGEALTGQSGRDIIYGYDGGDTLSGLAGGDDLYGGEGADTLDGGDGGDLLEGEAGDDVLNGQTGADTVRGGAGADQVFGGAGADTLEGGDGDDALDGGDGADLLTGGAGVDTLSFANSAQGVAVNFASGLLSGGEAEGDMLGDAFERLIGSAHDDTLIGTSAAEAILGGGGADTLQGGGGADLLFGDAGADAIYGGDDVDEIHGGDGDDIIVGGAGADLLYGGAGADLLDAQGGGDLLVGGEGDDILDGGVGSDSYVVDENSGHDIIRDFDPDGADADQINFEGVDTARLWFEQIGDDLKISIIGADASETIEDWYASSPPANRRIEFQITNQNYTIDAEGLVLLMAAVPAKPADLAALAVLMADSTYASEWAEFWGINEAPALGGVLAQSGDEDVAIDVPVAASDDFTVAGLLRYDLQVFDDAGLTQLNAGVVQTWSVTGGEGAQTLHLTPALNKSGTFYARLKVFDLTDRVSEQVFTLSIAPIADTPTISQAQALADTLDSGALALGVQAGLGDTDGSEILEIEISGVPAALTLNHGTALGGGAWSLTQAQLSGLALIGAASFAQDLTLTVTVTARESANSATATVQTTFAVPINARPTDISAGAVTINENASNGTAVATFVGVDADGAADIVSYALMETASGRFAIHATTGQLSVANGAALNYEAVSSHQIIVQVTDSHGLTYSKTFNVSIANVNETPTDIVPPASLAVNENAANGTAVGAFTTTDPDTGDTKAYSLLNDAGGRFSIETATGQLRVANSALLNYEAATQHTIRVRVTDSGGLTREEDFVVAINQQNEAPTDISAPALAVNEMAANGTVIASFSGADPDVGDTRTYTLLDSAGGRFAISLAGQLTVANGALLDRETAASHTIRVQIKDSGNLTRWEDFVVAVNNLNETPTDIIPGGVTVNENAANGTVIGAFTSTDPDVGDTKSYSLTNDAGGRFAINASNGQLSVANGALLNAEAASSHAISVRVTDSGGLSRTEAFTVYVSDVNEPVNMTAFTFSVSEAAPGALQTLIGTVSATDIDTNPANRVHTFDFIGGAYTNFSLDATTGQIRLVNALNYEAQSQYSVQIRVTNGAYTSWAWTTINVDNVNEAHNVVGYTKNLTVSAAPNLLCGTFQVTDQDTSPSSFIATAGSIAWSIVSVWQDSAGYVATNTYSIVNGALRSQYYGDGYRHQDKVVVMGGGRTAQAIVNYETDQPWPPIVLDLDGDGLELIAPTTTSMPFDVDGDGVLDLTGWVGADDAMLALDRDGDGVITHGAEIAFMHDADGAASDLEGLRAYDTNSDGFFSADDAQFAEFRLWQDANQDGVSQSGELATLAARGITAINLTMTLTGATPDNLTDNVIYGTAEYVRSDGTLGVVGDVFLGYTAGENGLPPVIFDLDGGGVALTSRLASKVLFDADNDGAAQRTGWFGAGEGVLALDRNGDGRIGSGAEISFASDLPGARTDLEGLTAYDSDDNGFFDAGDARFGAFRIWRDANQDGVSQAGELKSLYDWNIQAINLTPRLTGQSLAGATDNVVFATTDFVRTDGTLGSASDVVLSYDDDDPAQREKDPFAELRSRLANSQIRRPAGHTIGRDDPMRWMFPDAEGANAEPQLEEVAAGKSRRTRADASAYPFAPELFGERQGDQAPAPVEASLGAASGSALHRGLGVADGRVLQMVNAMAGFDAREAADLSRGRRLDPKVAELLTSLPDIR